MGFMVGPRPGEILGFRWDDIDINGGRAQISQMLKREKAGLRLGEVKTSKSRRAFDLPSPVIDALRRHRKRQNEERLAAGPLWEDWGLVFTTAVGATMTRATSVERSIDSPREPGSDVGVHTTSATRPTRCSPLRAYPRIS
jgi:integrase